jgi:coenzyme PQQ precursor peptide PqqA
MIFELPPRRVGVAAGDNSDPKVNFMSWTTPKFEEVVLCCEINSYVSAKL